eukprot:1420109-Heterocapsa_arctica.AAC.1
MHNSRPRTEGNTRARTGGIPTRRARAHEKQLGPRQAADPRSRRACSYPRAQALRPREASRAGLEGGRREDPPGDLA